MLNRTNDIDNHIEQILFAWYDHTLFIIMILTSITIGIYFACTGTRKMQKAVTDEYFLGGKMMQVIPIALSLIASHITSISLMSVPADVYSHGAMYLLSTVSICLVAFVTSYIYLPVFFNLQLNSVFEYLQLRFDLTLRLVCSITSVANIVLTNAIIIFVPALAYSQATGVSTYYVIPAICGICTFYTTIGGLKAVVWTDTIQLGITGASVIFIFCLGLHRAEGFAAVFKAAHEGGRLQFDFDWDMTKRETVVPVLMYWFLQYLKLCAMGQECVLKFMSLPSLRNARQSLFIFCFGMIVVKCIIVITGLIIYKLYHDCDPLQAGLIGKIDKLVPFYVAQITAHIPGLSGLFIAGIFCTAFSIVSCLINAVAATLYQDLVSLFYMEAQTNVGRTKLIVKLLVCAVGVVTTLLALLVEHLGAILPLSISIFSLPLGSFIGIFSLGIMCPRANSKGALWGFVASLTIVTWMFVGAQWHKSTGSISFVPDHISTDKCPFNVIPQIAVDNSTSILTPQRSEVFILYRITHYYYAAIGTVVCILVGYVVSLLFPEKNRVLDKRLFASFVHFMIKDNVKEQYDTIERSSKLIEMSAVDS